VLGVLFQLVWCTIIFWISIPCQFHVWNVCNENNIKVLWTAVQRNFLTVPCMMTLTHQSADSTAWTGGLMVFNYHSWYCVNSGQLPTPIFDYMHDSQDSVIQCSTSRGFVSIPIPWIYSSVLWTTETVKHTSSQSNSTFSALILAGD